MERHIHNPWTWNTGLGFEQAVEVRGGERTVYCAGQTAVDADGAPLAGGDYAKQFEVALDNVATVLAQAGMTLADVVRMNIYVTDVGSHFSALGDLVSLLERHGLRAGGTLLQVEALADPQLLVELEATAVT